MQKNLYKIWRFFLPIIFLIVWVHFLKDITQDILKISTFLDLLGNINEDLSAFPPLIQKIIIALGFVSFGVETFLIMAIPKVIKDKGRSKLEPYVIGSLLILVIYFISVVLMDPHYRI